MDDMGILYLVFRHARTSDGAIVAASEQMSPLTICLE